MEEHLLFVQSNIVNVKGLCNVKGLSNLNFAARNSANISDSCDCIGTQIDILLEFCYPHIFK